MSRRIQVDLTLDTDMDRVAEVAYGIAEKLRENDLRELHNELVSLCRWHPARAAQIPDRARGVVRPRDTVFCFVGSVRVDNGGPD